MSFCSLSGPRNVRTPRPADTGLAARFNPLFSRNSALNSARLPADANMAATKYSWHFPSMTSSQIRATKEITSFSHRRLLSAASSRAKDRFGATLVESASSSVAACMATTTTTTSVTIMDASSSSSSPYSRVLHSHLLHPLLLHHHLRHLLHLHLLHLRLIRLSIIPPILILPPPLLLLLLLLLIICIHYPSPPHFFFL